MGTELALHAQRKRYLEFALTHLPQPHKRPFATAQKERFDLWRIRARAKHNAPNNESLTKLSGIDEKVVLLFVAEEISEVIPI